MKKLFILGIALVALNTNAGTVKSQDAFKCENSQGNFTRGNDGKGKNIPSADPEFMNPETLLNVANERQVECIIAEDNKIIESTLRNEGDLLYIEKSIEDIIADDNRIIESGNTTEIHPLYIEPSIEDKIIEDRAIIEGENTNQVQPLDFENINKKQQIKAGENTLLVG